MFHKTNSFKDLKTKTGAIPLKFDQEKKQHSCAKSMETFVLTFLFLRVDKDESGSEARSKLMVELVRERIGVGQVSVIKQSSVWMLI